MKTERRWLKSAIKATQTEEILLPWAAKRADKQPTPPTPAVVYLETLPPRALHFAIAAR
jgi:hypothetical protein